MPSAMQGLFRRYFATLATLVSVSVLAVGLTLALYHYTQELQRAHDVQTAEARAAAASIDAYLRGIEGMLQPLARRLPAGLAASREVQASDFRDALKFQPAILNIRSLDDQHRETNFVSRIEADRVESHQLQSSLKPLLERCQAAFCYGPVFVRDQTEPYVTLVAPGPGQESLAAEISVRFIDDLLAKLSPGKSGRAYLVDLNGHLLAHPDLRTLLGGTDVSRLVQVESIRDARRQGQAELPSVWGRSPDGGTVFSSATRIHGPDWLLCVEQPSGEILRAVQTTIGVTVLVLGLGIAAASLASLLLARQLAKPILQLRDGAQRLGSGNLAAKIHIESRDEIQSVAVAFNSMAESLRGLYENLESKVADRTRDLAQANVQITRQARELSILNGTLEAQLDELKSKREAADRASAAKTRFVAAASHDLRQPMHAVSLLVGILADRQISPEISALLTKIQLSVSALETLFETLLDISRLDAGIVAPNRTCISVESLFEAVVLTHAQVATDKGLRFRVLARRTLIHTDHALLLSMLANLVSNAIKYTAQGRIDVCCRKQGSCITLLVSDTGPGIPDTELGRIFEEFYQLPDSNRGHGHGLGLGLAIVKRTAELLGHGLSVRSRPGSGSVFGICVPVATADQFKLMTPPIEAPWHPVLAGAFIAIVDDDQDARFATESVFRSWHCHVISARCGDTLRLELAQHLRQPDIVIADYRLANGGTGLEFIQELRREAEIQIPAILLTADLDSGLAAIAQTHDIILLQKPANALRIRRAVMDLMPAPHDGVSSLPLREASNTPHRTSVPAAPRR